MLPPAFALNNVAAVLVDAGQDLPVAEKSLKTAIKIIRENKRIEVFLSNNGNTTFDDAVASLLPTYELEQLVDDVATALNDAQKCSLRHTSTIASPSNNKAPSSCKRISKNHPIFLDESDFDDHGLDQQSVIVLYNLSLMHLRAGMYPTALKLFCLSYDFLCASDARHDRSSLRMLNIQKFVLEHLIDILPSGEDFDEDVFSNLCHELMLLESNMLARSAKAVACAA